jgi:TolB-like protein
MSEEISTALSRFPGIRVIAPSATEHFEESGSDVGLRASELGVAFLLRGSVRRGPRNVRVAAQLLDAATGALVWGENYDAVLETAALIETQDRIAGKGGIGRRGLPGCHHARRTRCSASPRNGQLRGI